MSSLPSPGLWPPTSGFSFPVVLGFCAAVAAPVLAYFGGRGQAAAQLQTALNDAFRSLTAELQGDRSVLIARVSALEAENRELRQRADSLQWLLAQHEITLPKELER